MSFKNERNMYLKKLKEMKKRAENGVLTKNDQKTMVDILIKLTYKSFERDIREEEAERTHEEIMNTMSWDELNS